MFWGLWFYGFEVCGFEVSGFVVCGCRVCGLRVCGLKFVGLGFVGCSGYLFFVLWFMDCRVVVGVCGFVRFEKFISIEFFKARFIST